MWKVVKRIKDADVRSATDSTHVCTGCWEKLKVGWNKASKCWTTSVPCNHFRDSPKCAPDLSKQLRGKDSAKRARMTQGSLSCMTLSPESKALTKAAQWYIYGTSRISKATFEDEYFRGMVQAYFECGGGKDKATVFSPQMK